MPARRPLILALAVLALTLLAPAAARADIARPVTDRRLANGMRLIVSPDPGCADVSVHLRYDAGSRDEPAGLEGLAHFVEHLMFLGTKHAPRTRLFQLLERAGATNVNAITDPDATVYHETLPPERLELALWLESDRMAHALRDLDQATLDAGRAEVLNEHRLRVTEAPLGALIPYVRAALFPAWHPYDHLPIGMPASLQRITVADARAFAGTWYGPANATLVITGNVEPRAAGLLAEKYFGTLPPRPPPPRPAVPSTLPRVATLLHLGASVTRERIEMAWVTPAHGAPGDAELDIAAALLVNHGVGWLETTLSRAPRLATSVSAGQDSMALASVFAIRLTVADRRSIQEAFLGVLAALQKFDTGVADEEIERVQRALENGRAFALETSFGLAQSLAAAAELGPLPPVFDGGLGRYRRITPASVRAAVRTWLGRRPWVIGAGHPVAGRSLEGELLAIQESAW